MPNRPKQHQLEDLSRLKFEMCLPRNWVFRNKGQDYGIDGEIELFDSNGNAQGLLCYVQLKATSSEKESKIFNVDFKIDTLKYFSQLEIPVLLVRYSEHQDKIFIKWINSVDLTFAKIDAKSFRIKLEKKSDWNENSSKHIERDLKNIKKLKSGFFSLPLPCSILINDAKVKKFSDIILKVKLRNSLSKFSDFLNFSDEIDDSIVLIILENNTLQIKISILNGVYFHNIDLRENEDFIEDLAEDILLGLAMCMIILGQIDYSGKIIFENNLQNRLVEKEELLIRFLPPLLESSYLKNTLELISDIFTINDKEIILVPSIINILLKSRTQNKLKINLIENFFKTRLIKANEIKLDGLIATSYYNLGNFYRSKGRHLESIHNYVLAKKYDISYLERPYYYREIAGVCFEIRKFKFSSFFYQKAIKLGDVNQTKALLADALLFSGEYKKANDKFAEYISLEENPFEEFLLKSILLHNILITHKIIYQKRNKKEADKLADIKKNQKKDLRFENLERALEYDLLSGLAWFNLGIEKKDDNPVEATFCFAMCAITNLIDIEAWTFAFLSFLRSGEESNLLIGGLIIQTAYHHNRDEFLAHLFGILENNNSKNKDILEMIDKMLRKNLKEDKDVVLRLINKSGYKEIEIK